MNPRDRAIFLVLAGLVLNVLAALLDIVNIYANGAYHLSLIHILTPSTAR